MKSVELFSGAGGLNLGITQAGFEPQAIVEWNGDACETIRKNFKRKTSPDTSPLHEMDARLFNYRSIKTQIDLLAAGPPCQPFSLAGKHEGSSDNRNMFPEVFRAVRSLKPKAILIENVRGIGRPSFSSYLNYILLQLSFPELSKKNGEKWRSHLARLKRHEKKDKRNGLTYVVKHKFLNAADFGVPQSRERLIMVGIRSDLKKAWDFPKETHSADALIWEKWVSEEYWKRHKLKSSHRSAVPKDLKAKVAEMKKSRARPKLQAWKTVRDAIHNLPDPKASTKSGKIENHNYIGGARAYVGHTGSSFDVPAKTLKAGSHGVPGGENMLAYRNGKVRYFTIRECARLQTFPDDYVFSGPWSSATRQIGNAVPVQLGHVVANSIKSMLRTPSKQKK